MRGLRRRIVFGLVFESVSVSVFVFVFEGGGRGRERIGGREVLQLFALAPRERGEGKGWGIPTNYAHGSWEE